MPSQIRPASEQVFLFTLMAKLAVGAVLSTMLVRFPWFRRILLTEKRDWPERLLFPASPGPPLPAGALWRPPLTNAPAGPAPSRAFRAGGAPRPRARAPAAGSG